ncbi:MAG: hypothetical protein ABSD74_02895 [Rhizomicrobium sp.]
MTKHDRKGLVQYSGMGTHGGLVQEVSVSYWEQHRSQLDSGPAFDILDTAANISGSLTMLNTDSHISQIIISDNASVTVSVAELTGDAIALSKLINANNTAATVTVSDTAAHIGASFATIATEGQVTQIVVSDNGVVTLTAAQSNYTAAVGELVNENNSAANVHVKDTAVNLATYLNAIQDDGSTVTEVIVSNSTAMTLTAQQVSLDATALGKVIYNNGGTVHFLVNDTGANIGTYLNALEAQTKITTITDNNNAAVNISVAEITSDAGALAKIVNANASAYTLNVTDNAADVANGASAINGNSHIVSVSISDSAANVQANLDGLEGVSHSIPMTIVLTDVGTPTITITDTQFTNDASVLADITSAYNLDVTGITVAGAAAAYADSHITSFAVTDSASNVQAGIDSLENYVSKISSISLTNVGTPTLTVTATQYTNDGSVLAVISGSWNLDITGATAEQAGSWSGAPHVNLIDVADTAGDIGPELTTLLGVAQAGHLGTIDVTDAGTITTTEATFTECASVFADITSGYSVALTAVAAADAAGLVAGNTHITSLSISDSALDVQNNLDSLEGVASKITTIALTDVGTPTLTIADSQYFSDATVIGDIAGSYNLAVTGATAAHAITEGANSHVTSITISDLAANIQSNLDSLESVHSKITSILLTDGSTPTITISETQYHNDSAILADISSTYDLTLTSVLAADAVTLAGATVGGGTVTQLYVSDTAAHIEASLANLDNADVIKAVITDGSSIQINVASLEANGAALAKLYASDGTDAATVTISDTASNITGDLGGLNSDLQVTKIIVSDNGLTSVTVSEITTYSHALSELYESNGITPAYLTVVDTANNIQSNFDTLNGLSRVAQINISNNGTITLSAESAANDTTALGELYESNGTTPAKVVVADLSGNVQSYLTGLESNASHISSITLTDGSPALSVAYSGFSAAEAVLADISTSFALTVTGATVAEAGSLPGTITADNIHASSLGITIDDSSTNVQNGLATLEALSGAGELGPITLNDGSPAISVAYSGFSAAVGVLDKIETAFALTVTGATVAQASGVPAAAVGIDTGSLTITIDDTSTDVQNGLAALETLHTDGYLGAITLSDGSPAISVAYSGFTAAEPVLADISTSFALTVTGATVAETSGIPAAVAGDHLSSLTITIDDSSTNVQSGYSTLESLYAANELGAITLNDGSTPTITLTASQVTSTSGHGVFDEIASTFDVAITGALAAQVGTIVTDVSDNTNATLTSLIVDDTAGNISSAFNSLETYAGDLTKVIVSDSGQNEVTLNVASVIADGTVESKLYDAGGVTPASIAVSDTASNISAAIDSLDSNTHVNKIIVSDSGLGNQVTVSVAQLASDATALGELYDANGTTPASITVMDTQAAISADFDALNADTQVTSIVMTTPNFEATAEQIGNDGHAMNEVSYDGGRFNLNIYDTAANVSQYLNQIETAVTHGYTYANISSIGISDDGAITLDVAQLTSDATALGMIEGASGLVVKDTASNISAAFGSLNANGYALGIEKIVVSDSASNTVTISASEAADDTSALGKLYQANGTSPALVDVSDTASNISGVFDALNTNHAYIAEIVVTDSGSHEVTLSAASAVADTAAEGLLYQSNGSTPADIAVADTAVNIANNLAAIQADTHINNIYVSDTAQNIANQFDDLNSLTYLTGITINDGGTLSISYSTLTSDTKAFGLINNASFNVSITDVLVANALTLASTVTSENAHADLTSISVRDTTLNIENNFDALNSLAHLVAIDTSTNGEVTLSVASAINDTYAESILNSIDGSNVRVTDNAGNVAANATAINANSHIDQVYVNDTAGNIASNFGALNGIDNLTFVNITSGTLSITETQLTTDTRAFGAIHTNPFSVDITNVLAADAVNIAGEVSSENQYAILNSISVTDTASNIANAFGALNGVANLTQIIVSDSGSHEVTLNVSAALADTTAEGLLYESNGTTPADIAVADTAVNIADNLAAIQDNLHINAIYVSDTAQNIANQFDDLNSLTYLTGIMINDGGTLSLSYATLTTDTKAFGLITNASFNVSITDVSAANALTLASTVHGENAHADLTSIYVSDIASAISGVFGELNSLAGLAQIVVSDSGSNEVTLNVAAALADTTAESLLYQNGGVTPASVQVSDNAADVAGNATALNANTHINHVYVVDNAANVGTNFDNLNGVDHLSIDITSGSLSITEYQLTHDTAAFAAITTANFTLDVTNVLAADAGSIAGEVSSGNANANLVSIAVNDTVDNVAANAVALEGNNKVTYVLASGTASDVAAHIDTLNGVQDIHIDITGGGTLSISYTQLTNDTAALDGITVPFNLAVTGVTVAELSSVATDVAGLTGSPTLTSISVSDTGGNVGSSLDTLNNFAHLTAIDLTGGALTITETQLINDTTALGLINTDNGSFDVAVSGVKAADVGTVEGDVFGYGNAVLTSLTVSDTASNIGTYFGLLESGFVTKVIVTDSNTNEVTITASQALDDGAVFAKLYQQDGTDLANVEVRDTASNLSYETFSGLNDVSAVNKIIVSDSGTGGVVQILVTELLIDTTALGELYQADGSTPAKVEIVDNAADIAGSATALNSSSYVGSVLVQDSTTNVATYLDTLNGVNHLSIELEGGGTQTLTITEYQLTNDTNALAAITNATYDIAVTSATAANAAADAATSHVTSVSVVDSASNIEAHFGALNGIGSTLVAIDNTGPGEITLNAATAVADTYAESVLTGSGGTHVAINDNAANVAGLASQIDANVYINSVIVTDTVADVEANYTQLSTVKDLTINLTGGPLTITEYQLVNEANLLTDIAGSFDVAVTSVLAADVGNIQGEVTAANSQATLTSISVTDTAANISGHFGSLNTTALVSKIIVSDSASNEVQISVSELGDTTALSELYQADGTDHALVTVYDTALAISGSLTAIIDSPYVNKVDISDNGALTITAQQAVTYSGALGEFYNANGTTHATIDVLDTAGNISSHFDSLNGIADDLGKIIVSDSGTGGEVAIKFASYESDGAALAELYNAGGNTLANVAVEDTGSNISAALNTLNTATRVDHIIISDNAPLALAAASAVDDTHALNELENANHTAVSLTISDNAANISNYIDQLNAINTISSVFISDGNPLVISAEQVASDTSVLGKLDAGSSIDVSDTGANISEYLAALAANNDIVEIIDSNNAALTVTVAELDNYASLLSEIVNNDQVTPATIDVKDTAANIEAALGDLNANTTPAAIIISDNAPLTMSIADFTTDTSLLSRLQNANGSPYHIDISDNGSNISSALDSLNNDSHVAIVVDTNDAAITLSVSQITNDASILSVLFNSDNTPYTLSVHDTAGNLTTAFDSLDHNSHVASIVVTDSGLGNEVIVSVAQLTSDAHALGMLYDANGVTPADVTVSDTAANITADLGGLNGNGQVNKVIVSNSASSEVQVSVAQLASDSHLLGELYNADGISRASVTVVDTAGNLSGTEFDALNGNVQVNKIIVSDSGSGNEVAISVNQLTNDTTALAELYDANGTTPAKVVVLDSASNIQNDLAGLNSNTQVNQIWVSDSAINEVTVNVAGLATYATALAELYDANGSTHASVTVSDTAADITNDLSGLNSDTQVNKIDVSDSNINEVTVSMAQLTAYGRALGELYNANGLSLANIIVSDTAANITNGLGALQSDGQINKIIVTDSASNEVNVSVAGLTTYASALNELYDANGSTPAKVVVSDTASNITAGLGTLNGDSQVNKIIVSDSGSNEVVVNVAQLAGDATALGELYNLGGSTHANVTVSDLSYNISLAFDSLNGNSQVNKIIASDDPGGFGPEVTLQVAQLTTDAHALSELYQSDGHTLADVYINDTAANISGAAFDALNNDSRVNGIVINNGGTVIINALQAHNDTTALNELYAGNLGNAATVEVLDSSANIAAQLDNLNANLHVGEIVFTNQAPVMTLSASQVADDTRALGIIAADNVNSYALSIDVVDNGANISTYLDALEANSDIVSITISDNAAITLTANQLLVADTTAVGLLANQGGGTVHLILDDTASNISANITDLEAYTSGNQQITSVVISDNAAVSVTIGDLSLDGALISEFSNANHTPYMLNVTGNASEISGALATLQSYLSGGHVESITVTDNGAIDVNVADITTYASVLAKLVDGDASPYTLAVSDLAGNVAGDLGALNSNTHVVSIFLSDGGTPTLTITEGQLTSDAAAIGEITNGSFNVAVTNVLAANASSIASELSTDNHNAVLTSISVSDSASNVAANLGSLNGLAELTSITLTGGGTQTLSITESELKTDTAALDLITNNPYDLAVTNVAAADAASIAGYAAAITSHDVLSSIAVLDSAANVQTYLNSLESVASGSIPLTIALTGGGTQTLTITETEYHSDALALDDITSAFQLAVTSVLAADATSIAGDSRVVSIAIDDSAANVQTALDALESVHGKITNIVLTDGSTPTLTITETQFDNDASVLNDITSPYNLSVNHVLAADAATVALNSHVTSISVYDTGANISSALDALNANLDVNSIVISDNAALSLAAHSAVLDSRALGLLSNANNQPVTLTVVDTAANVAQYLDDLNGIATISAITISDNNPLTLKAYQVADDTAALAKALNANGQPILINVNDLAGNISTYLNQLEANNNIGTITVSDNLSVVASIAQLTSDADALAALVNGNGSSATVKVLDTGADITADLGNLNSDTQVTSIVISNNAQLTLNVSEVVNDTRALSELSNANNAAVTEKIQDTALNIAAYLNSLQADAQITSVVVSNNVALTLTAAQIANDAGILAEVSNRDGAAVSFNVVDTAADISTYLNQLAANAKIATITVSDNNSVTLSVAQMSSDAAALGKLVNQNGNPYTLNVLDTAANLSGTEFDALNANTHVTSIVISDNNAITLTMSEYDNDTRALGELSNANGQPYQIDIIDTGAHLSGTVLGILNGNSHVASITISDNGFIGLSVSQMENDTRALGELHNANGSPYSMIITDTAANISAAIAQLGQQGHVGYIDVSDNGVVTSTYALYLQYNNIFHDIQGTHYLDITNVTGQQYTSFTETVNGNEQVTLADYYSGANLVEQISYTYNQDGSYIANGSDIVGKPYTSFTWDFNAAHQITNAEYFLANGSEYENVAYTYNQDGTTSELITGLSGINQETVLLDQHGNLENEFIFYTNNTETVYFYENGQTFTSSGETTGLKITAGTTGHTFNFNGDYGMIYISNFSAASDTINWDHNDFANIAAVEAHARQDGAGDTLVTLDNNDVIQFTGVSLAQFEAYAQDWHFI